MKIYKNNQISFYKKILIEVYLNKPLKKLLNKFIKNIF